ncbi:hypothetical protein BH10CYA1_BH10CYA1_48010 [soil metagenome]
MQQNQDLPNNFLEETFLQSAKKPLIETDDTLQNLKLSDLPWQTIKESAELAERSNRTKDAVRLWYTALCVAQTDEGDLSEGVMYALDALGQLYLSSRNFKKAQKMFLEAIRIKSLRYGGTHSMVSLSLYHLSTLYTRQGLVERGKMLRSCISRRIIEMKS